MAVAYVANIAGSNVNGGNWTASGLPAGTAAGDLVLAVIAGRGNVNVIANTANGWIAVHNQWATAETSTVANTGHGGLTVAYFKYEGVAPDLVFYRTLGDAARGVLCTLRGVNFTASVGNSSIRDNANTAAPYSAAITAGPSNFLVGCMGAGNDNALGSGAANCATDPVAASWTNRHNAVTTTGADTSIGVSSATKNTAGGDTGQFNFPASYAGLHVISFVEFVAAVAPTAPTSLTVTVFSDAKMNLAWTAAANGGQAVTGYRIERESPVGGGWSNRVANTGTTTTSYQDTGLTAGTQYNYRISAINRVPLLGTASTALANTTAQGGVGVLTGAQMGFPYC